VPNRVTDAKVLLLCGRTLVASWVLAPDGVKSARVIDELARLQLGARRIGCSIRVSGACEELRALLALTGLSEIVRSDGDVVVEVGGEAEGGEQVGVEEVVVTDDPPA
jgi:hypothetical protein